MSYVRQTIYIRHPNDRWEEKLNEYAEQRPGARLVSVVFRGRHEEGALGSPVIDAVWEVTS